MKMANLKQSLSAEIAKAVKKSPKLKSHKASSANSICKDVEKQVIKALSALSSDLSTLTRHIDGFRKTHLEDKPHHPHKKMMQDEITNMLKYNKDTASLTVLAKGITDVVVKHVIEESETQAEKAANNRTMTIKNKINKETTMKQ